MRAAAEGCEAARVAAAWLAWCLTGPLEDTTCSIRAEQRTGACGAEAWLLAHVRIHVELVLMEAL